MFANGAVRVNEEVEAEFHLDAPDTMPAEEASLAEFQPIDALLTAALGDEPRPSLPPVAHMAPRTSGNDRIAVAAGEQPLVAESVVDLIGRSDG